VVRTPAMRRCLVDGKVLPAGAGQDEAERGSPVCSGDGEAAMDSGAEGLIGVGWALVTDDVHREFPQLQEGEGEVRDHPAEKEKCVGASSPWRENQRRRQVEMWRGAAAARPPARTGDRGGRGGCARPADGEKNGRGEKWGHERRRHPF
jgi:hypothetical protein